MPILQSFYLSSYLFPKRVNALLKQTPGMYKDSPNLLEQNCQ